MASPNISAANLVPVPVFSLALCHISIVNATFTTPKVAFTMPKCGI